LLPTELAKTETRYQLIKDYSCWAFTISIDSLFEIKPVVFEDYETKKAKRSKDMKPEMAWNQVRLKKARCFNFVYTKEIGLF